VEPALQVLRVSPVTDPRHGEMIAAGITDPRAGGQFHTYALELSGWVTSRRPVVECLQIVHADRPLWRVPPQADLAPLAGPQPDGIVVRGFAAAFSTLTLPPRFEVSLSASLDDESVVGLGTIEAQRAEVRTGFRARYRPLMVSTFGRTGSRAFLQLLGAHPRIIAYLAPHFEPKVASYWLEILRALSEPKSYLRQMAPSGFRKNWWLGDDTPKLWRFPDAELQDWMGREAVEALASICQERVDALNARIAERSGQPDAVYFAEKFTASTAPSLMWELYPDAREVFLVRDFRDMVASVLAFNRKKGRQAFGRQGAKSDEDYVRRLSRYARDLVSDWQRRSARAHVVRYEDMALRPVETVEALLRYLELEASEQEVAAMIETVGYVPPEMREHLTSSGLEASIDRWRLDLDDDLKRACHEAFGEALEVFGYPVER
jgi:hypothetical protein